MFFWREVLRSVEMPPLEFVEEAAEHAIIEATVACCPLEGEPLPKSEKVDGKLQPQRLGPPALVSISSHLVPEFVKSLKGSEIRIKD